jgi:hypothetical protein
LGVLKERRRKFGTRKKIPGSQPCPIREEHNADRMIKEEGDFPEVSR